MNKTIIIFTTSLVLACVLGAALIYTGSHSPKPSAVPQTEQAKTEVKSSPTPTTSSSMNPFFSISEGIRLEYPKTWIKAESTEEFIVLKSSENAEVKVSIVISDQSLKSPNLQEFNEQYLEALKKAEPKKDILEEGYTTFAGLQAYKVVYVGESSGHQYKWLQLWIIRNDKAYVITYASPEPSFITYSADYESIISSVLFTK